MRLLAGVVVLAVTGEALAASPVLDGIEVVGHQATAVRLRLSAPAIAQARSLPPSGDVPDRIYIDLAGVTVSPTLNRLVGGAGAILRVRAGQFDRTTARVVLDLSGPLAFTMQQSGETITIQLSTPVAQAPAAGPPPTPDRPPVAATPRPPDTARAAPPSPPAPSLPPKEPSPAPVKAAPAPVAQSSPAERSPASVVPEPPARRPVAAATPPAGPSPAAPPERVPTPPRPAVTPGAVAGDDRGATPPAPVAASAPPADPAPAPPAEHQPAPAEPPSAAPATEPTPNADIPPPAVPRLPSLFPSMGALPGAMIALQNGRDLDHHRAATPPPVAAPTPPPAPPARRDVPTSLAAAEPPVDRLPPHEMEATPSSPVGPPAPPEPTKTARAMPATPAEPARPPSAAVPPRAERPPAPLAATPRRPVTRAPHPLVVLDAGHGGRDPGAEGVGGVLEKDVVLRVTRLVARRLAARLPVDVMMTRSDDSFIPIERRLALPSERATLFISLHANACADPTARGLEVFYGGGAVQTASTRGGSGPAALLGRCLDEALEARIGGVRGGARPGTFGVLVRNPVPSALVEIGYLTHPDEAARAQDTGFHELIADALVDGIAAFLRASAPPL